MTTTQRSGTTVKGGAYSAIDTLLSLGDALRGTRWITVQLSESSMREGDHYAIEKLVDLIEERSAVLHPGLSQA